MKLITRIAAALAVGLCPFIFWLAMQTWLFHRSPLDLLRVDPVTFAVFPVLGVVVALAAALFMHRLASERDIEQQALHRLIKLDPVTRALNMQGFHDLFDGSVALAHRRKLPLTLMRIRFHVLGSASRRAAGREAAAKALAHELMHKRRREDIVARSGADEFLLLLPGTGLSGAETVARNLLAKKLLLDPDGHASEISFKIGVAALHRLDAGNHLLRRSLQALSAARESSNGLGMIADAPLEAKVSRPRVADPIGIDISAELWSQLLEPDGKEKRT